jgi:cadmium resistance protein CadD (predicted permease)
MDLIFLLLLLFVVPFLMSAWLPGRLSAAVWLIPLGLGVWFFVAWLDERQPTLREENDPGLVAFVGVVAVVVTASAAGLGRLVRSD